MPPPLLVYNEVNIIDLMDSKDLINKGMIYTCNIAGLYILG